MALPDLTPGFSLGISRRVAGKPYKAGSSKAGYYVLANDNPVQVTSNEIRRRAAQRANKSAKTSGGGGGGGGVVSTGPSAAEIKAQRQKQQKLSQFDQSISNLRRGINRLGLTQKSGSSSILSSYQNALNQLLLGRNQAEKAYGTTKKQSATDFVSAKNTIGAQSGNTLRGLRRLLGSRGAGGGSAYNIAAPQAVAREATIQRQGASDTFGRNMQALDTNWQNFLTGYRNELSGAASQRDEQLRELRSGTRRERGELLQTLADLVGKRAQTAGGSYTGAAQPFLNQANRALDTAATYRARPIRYNTRAFEAPELSEYTSEAATPTYQGEAAASDYISPYFSALLGRREEELAGA